MKSILEAFAFGYINPDMGTVKKDSQYGNIMQTISDYENELLSMLDDKSKQLFVKLSSAQSEASSIVNVDKFIYGYRLGVLMTMEVFKGNEDAIYGNESFE